MFLANWKSKRSRDKMLENMLALPKAPLNQYFLRDFQFYLHAIDSSSQAWWITAVIVGKSVTKHIDSLPTGRNVLKIGADWIKEYVPLTSVFQKVK